MRKDESNVTVERIKAVDSEVTPINTQYKVRVFSFCNIEDITDYHKLINTGGTVRIISEASEFGRNGCYSVATVWMETEDSGINIIGSSLLDRLES